MTPILALPQDHSLRRSLTEEMHLRRMPAFSAPARLLQLVMHSGEGHADDDRACADALCDRLGAPRPGPGRFISVAAGGYAFVWERHTEFSTYTFVREGAFGAPFGVEPWAGLPGDLIAALPGQLIRATQIAVRGRDEPAPTEAEVASLFAAEECVVCDVDDGAARIWSDFRLHEDGFGRLLIQDLSLSGGETSRLVQRLQEVGAYRNMALLGLPVAQALTPAVTRLESDLARLAQDVASGVEDEAALEELAALSAELARLSAETRYRMSATRAYAQLSLDRLHGLAPARVAGRQSLADFTERRLLPALRTCQSFSERLDDLSQRAAWISGLLRTRIETALARQSRDLLASMNLRTNLQLRLQETVEGLSVVAISYYAVGLIGYVVKPLAHGRIDPAWLTAIAAPVVAVGVWLALRRVRRRLQDAEG
ncbi:DUF3422 family protein [Phenylobacterium sp.]|jgi:uncharacterized membrane-anchored protein|uniref:DUF3422 family protein n=1 Tax=Phenylobacterium sp. TaxID=1871053 RepID=UPI003784320B